MRTFRELPEDEGFNVIKEWLEDHLHRRRMSIDRFCVATDSKIDATAVHRWYRDENRPFVRTMEVVCETLSRLPVYLPDGSTQTEDVSLREGLATYTPRPRAWVAHYLKNPTPTQKLKKKN